MIRRVYPGARGSLGKSQAAGGQPTRVGAVSASVLGILDPKLVIAIRNHDAVGVLAVPRNVDRVACQPCRWRGGGGGSVARGRGGGVAVWSRRQGGAAAALALPSRKVLRPNRTGKTGIPLFPQSRDEGVVGPGHPNDRVVSRSRCGCKIIDRRRQFGTARS